MDDYLLCSSWLSPAVTHISPLWEGNVIYGRLDGLKQVFDLIIKKDEDCVLVTDSGDINLFKFGEEYFVQSPEKRFFRFTEIPPQIKSWFSTGLRFYDKLFHLLPLGVLKEHYEAILQVNQRPHVKDNLLYLNFTPNNSLRRINLLYNINHNKILNFAKIEFPPNIAWPEYRKSLINCFEWSARSKFVLCPEGMSIDTFRIWETLYLRSIPIIERSGFSEYLKDLPILIVDNFNYITEELLNEAFHQINGKERNRDYLTRWYYFMNKIKFVSRVDDYLL